MQLLNWGYLYQLSYPKRGPHFFLGFPGQTCFNRSDMDNPSDFPGKNLIHPMPWVFPARKAGELDAFWEENPI